MNLVIWAGADSQSTRAISSLFRYPLPACLAPKYKENKVLSFRLGGEPRTADATQFRAGIQTADAGRPAQT